jgi:predicted AlkP superfamily pyrophosphatase or phosphodiesterase
MLWVVIACSAPEHGGPSKPSPSAKRKLVVLIVVDQLPTWAFDRDRSLFTHGFARLARDGAFVRAAELPYASPFTAPGHAAIGTGAPPSVTGVIGNSWYRRDEARERDAEYDVASPPWTVGPSQGGTLSADDGASGRALRVDGLAEALREASPRSKSVAIGLKARGAVFVAGRKPDLAIWYEAAAGGMTTSKRYASEAPAWLVQLAKDKPASRFFTQTWEARDPALLARVTGIADDAPGEGSMYGLGTTFPHALAQSDAPGRAIVHTPFADDLVFETAVAALDGMQLGTADATDLLAISFNAHDYAGHLWGPDSWEVLDLMLRLDERLGALFDILDKRVGNYAVVLTSDHGATRVVERSDHADARRVRSAEIIDAAERAMAQFAHGPWVATVLANNVYMRPGFGAEPIERRQASLDAAAAAIAKLPGIAIAKRTDQLTGACDARAGLERAVCASIDPSQSGELFVAPVAGSLITDYTSGTHHDAPFDDNRRVPIFVMAPGLAGKTGEGSLLQVAPTVAALLGIPPPAAATAKPLFGLQR